MGDNKNDGGARPFQLRPSMLSGGGGGFTSFGMNSNDGSKKGFLLRPSALTSAADKIETNNKKETTKRQHESDDVSSNDSDVNDNEVKKKIQKCEEKEDSVEQPALKLTEDIQKPTGIGTFGFATKKDSVDNNEKDDKKSEATPNYFAQANNTSSKVSFVFGNNANSSATGGFSALKKDEDSGEEVNKSNNVSNGDTATTLTSNEKEKLLENADEYQKNHDKKQQYHEVDHKTGEEGEKHVLQTFCKLHLFDKDKKTWLEKGRGTLKLNDICQAEGIFQSRLVFRTQGTNIVQLNTMLWPDMCCEKVKEKNVRISAMNSDTKEVCVYLLSCNIKDRLQTFTAIDRRIEALKRHRDSMSSKSSQAMRSSDDKTVGSLNTDESNDTQSNLPQSLSNQDDSLEHQPESNSSNEVSS